LEQKTSTNMPNKVVHDGKGNNTVQQWTQSFSVQNKTVMTSHASTNWQRSFLLHYWHFLAGGIPQAAKTNAALWPLY
jgi:hypothetical protein